MRQYSVAVNATFSQLFWSFIFLDVALLTMGFGGLSIHMLLLHATIVGFAAISLGFCPNGFELTKTQMTTIVFLATLPALHFIPLPEALQPYLAPITLDFQAKTQAIFPDLSFQRKLALVPWIHGLKYATLLVDLAAITLMIIAPSPSMSLIKVWTMIFAPMFCGLTLLSNSVYFSGKGVASIFAGTYGGLVNRNHYAVFALAILFLVLYFCWETLNSIYQLLKNVRQKNTSTIVKKVSQLLYLLFLAVIDITSFQFLFSRSGVILLVLGLPVFLALAFLFCKEKIVSNKVIHFSVVLVVLLFLIFMPLGLGVERFQVSGMALGGRSQLWELGIQQVAKGQWLGTGLGSSEALIDPFLVKNPNDQFYLSDFHNDFLQWVIELGPLALLAVLFLALSLKTRYQKDFSERNAAQKVFVAMLLTLLGCLVFMNLIDFPLRPTSNRLFFFTIFFMGANRFRHSKLRPLRYPIYWIALAGVLIAGVSLRTFNEKAKRYQVKGDKVAWSASYGEFNKAENALANHALAEIFAVNQFSQVEFEEKLASSITAANRALCMQPFYVKAMNARLIAEMIQDKLKHPEFEQQAFLAFRHRAELIRGFTNDANVESRAALYFLFSLYPDKLGQEDQALFESLSKEFIEVKKGQAIRQAQE